MKYLLAIMLTCLSFASGSAGACRIRGPAILPLAMDYTAVALATVTGGDADGADVRFEMAFDGRIAQPRGRLDYRAGRMISAEIELSCGGPAGPRVGIGDRVVVVLVTGNGLQRPAGWMTLADAGRADEFFALYLGEQQPAARSRLRAQWLERSRARGADLVVGPVR